MISIQPWLERVILLGRFGSSRAVRLAAWCAANVTAK
jgi:hypothetical protein